MITDSAAPPPEPLQAPQRARLFLLIGIPILAVYGFGALREANWPLLGLIAINGAVIGASYLALMRGKLGLATIRPGIATYAALLLYMVAFSGEEHGHALWFFSFPLVAIMLLPPREGIIWSALCIAGAAAIMLIGIPAIGTSVYSPAFAIRFAVTAILITGGTFWSEIVLRRYQEETVAQRHATEAESTRLKAEIDVEFLREDIGSLLSESLDGLQRVKQIVRDLKDFSHVDQTEHQQADLNAALESTLNVVWNELKYKAEVVRELGDIPPVDCVPAQINQVFMNLLVNAAQAIPERGKIFVRSDQENNHVWFEIEDTGKGMSPEIQQRIFEPFYTTKPVGQGTGLGLSISYDIIVKKHGGRMDVRSEPGKGTCFRLWLPLNSPAAT